MIKKFFLLMIKLYQKIVSPLFGANCRFYPSCSHYGNDAIVKYGTAKGLWLLVKRLFKCHPYHPGGYDPVI